MKALTRLAVGVLLTVTPAIVAAQSTSPTIEQKTKAAAEKTGAYAKDAWLTSKTKIALYGDERVSGNEVKVETKNGAVTLRGKVATDAEKRAAEEVAKGVDGVTSVKNQLQVVPASARKAVDAKDDDLKMAVKARISREPRLNGSDVQVRADNGVVTLTGDVKDIGARARASEIARGVPGVRAVKNELKEKS